MTEEKKKGLVDILIGIPLKMDYFFPSVNYLYMSSAIFLYCAADILLLYFSYKFVFKMTG